MAGISTTNFVSPPSVKLSNDPLFQMAKPVDGFDAVNDGEAIAKKIKETAKPIEDEITLNKSRITELGVVEEKVQALVDSLQPLTNYLGVVSTTPNVFNRKVATSLQTDNSVAVTVGVDAKISEVPIKIMVNQLAQYDQIGSRNADPSDYFTSKTDGLSVSGNLVINGTSIPITDGSSDTENMSLQDIANAINASTSGVTAEIVTINNVGGTNQYRLVLTADVMATPIDLTGSDNIQGLLKLPFVTTNLDSLLAKFTYNGDLITRNTNTVKDLVPGLTFDLVNESSTGVTSVIKPDRNALIDSVVAFKDAYNDLVDALNRNSRRGADNQPLPDAVLDGHRILDTLRSILSQGSNGVVAGASTWDFSYFTKIGITIGAGADGKTTDLSGKMYLDEKLLEQAVYENYGKVQRLLGNTTGAGGSNFSIRELPTRLSDAVAGKDITVDYYKTDQGNFMATLSVNGQNPVTVSLDPARNRLIQGPAGTIFSGITIAYTGTEPTQGGNHVTETAWATQGLADSFMNLLKPTLIRKIRDSDSLQGDFEIAKEVIISQNKTQQKHVDDVYERAEKYKQDIISSMSEVYRQQGKLGEVNDILDAMQAALIGGR